MSEIFVRVTKASLRAAGTGVKDRRKIDLQNRSYTLSNKPR